VEERLYRPGPKRVLALDAGYARTALQLGLLSELERQLERRSGQPGLRLSGYFDLIGGVSLGAVVAASLALGRSVADAFQTLREAMSRGTSGAARGASRGRLDLERLEQILKRDFGEVELGGAGLKTGLAVFTRRLEASAHLVYTNAPRTPAFDGADGVYPHRHLLVRKLALASVGGGALGEPRTIRLSAPGAVVASGLDPVGHFVDASVAVGSNPSLQLLHVATLPPFGFGWLPGDQTLLLSSVGAGVAAPQAEEAQLAQWAADPHGADAAARQTHALMTSHHDGALATVQTMQAICASPRPWSLGGDLQDMRGMHLSPLPLAHFQRFDSRLEVYALAQLGLGLNERDVQALRGGSLGDPTIAQRLFEVGQRVGQAYFRTPNGGASQPWATLIFPPRFDPPEFADRPPGPPRNRLQALARTFDRKGN
jgi:hypothetical protein